MAVIILENAKWIWQQAELDMCASLYKKGLTAQQIGEKMGEDPDDIALAIFHLAQENKLEEAE